MKIVVNFLYKWRVLISTVGVLLIAWTLVAGLKKEHREEIASVRKLCIAKIASLRNEQREELTSWKNQYYAEIASSQKDFNNKVEELREDFSRKMRSLRDDTESINSLINKLNNEIDLLRYNHNSMDWDDSQRMDKIEQKLKDLEDKESELSRKVNWLEAKSLY